MDFYEVAGCLDDIAGVSSTAAKKCMLKAYAGIDGFKQVLAFIYDPYFTTGIKSQALNRYVPCSEVSTPEEIMEFLQVNNTGSSYAVSMALAFINQYEPGTITSWAAEGLVTKDLQIGVSVTTLNAVYGKQFIPVIGIMRGMHCPDDARGDFICTEKIDGNRRLIFVNNDSVSIYTRSGHKDDGLPELEADALKLPIGYMYDCECVAEGSYSDNIALRQASASLLNAGGKRTGIRALCFDMVSIADYRNGKSRMNALGRKAMLASAMDDYDSCCKLVEFAKEYDAMHAGHWASVVESLWGMFFPRDLYHIQALPILGIAHCKEDGIALAKPIWDANGEGVMMVEATSAYEVNPNPRKTLLKIKATSEFVCRCTDVFYGDNKYADILGSIGIAYQRPGDPKVYSVSVGSGFTDYQRKYYIDHPGKIIGQMVEIECFGESVNANGSYSLNCPIFKRVVGDND